MSFFVFGNLKVCFFGIRRSEKRFPFEDIGNSIP